MTHIEYCLWPQPRTFAFRISDQKWGNTGVPLAEPQRALLLAEGLNRYLESTGVTLGSSFDWLKWGSREDRSAPDRSSVSSNAISTHHCLIMDVVFWNPKRLPADLRHIRSLLVQTALLTPWMAPPECLCLCARVQVHVRACVCVCFCCFMEHTLEHSGSVSVCLHSRQCSSLWPYCTVAISLL